jgi:hypothetical protein
MSRNISLQEAGNRWVKNSLRSYLEGEKNLKWIAGILKGVGKDEIQSLFNSLGRSGMPERKTEFQEWLNRVDLPRKTD